MMTADSIMNSHEAAQIDGTWHAARPLDDRGSILSFLSLLKDVWAVYKRKAIAVKFYKQ